MFRRSQPERQILRTKGRKGFLTRTVAARKEKANDKIKSRCPCHVRRASQKGRTDTTGSPLDKAWPALRPDPFDPLLDFSRHPPLSFLFFSFFFLSFFLSGRPTLPGRRRCGRALRAQMVPHDDAVVHGRAPMRRSGHWRVRAGESGRVDEARRGTLAHSTWRVRPTRNLIKQP